MVKLRGSNVPKPTKNKPTKKKPAPTKRAPRRTAKMSADELTRSEAMIMERMEALEPDDPRYKVLESALAFKASWVLLAEHLSDVYAGKQYLLWGYPTFASYCVEEVRVTSATAKKLVRSYHWLDEEAPELKPRDNAGRFAPTREVPDYGTISVLADARKELQRERVPKDAYLALKQAALDGERSAGELRKELKAVLPEPEKNTATEKARTLRKALTASVKLIDLLREWGEDDGLVVSAEDLRDLIADRLPRDNEEQKAA